jgi:aspartate racemase
MKTIGLLGGMSWESTEVYYRLINEGVKTRLGGLHSAAIAMISVDFAPIAKMQAAGAWDEAAAVLAQHARRIEAAGAGLLVLCTNTMHRVAPAIEQAISIPLLHIADPTGQLIQRDGITKIGLLGTRFTMEQEFYRGRLASKYGLEVIVPDEADRGVVHDVIYGELCLGTIRDESRSRYLAIIEGLRRRGCGGVILGCTEIGMLVKPDDCSIPLFDTTALHAAAAVDLALKGEP